MKLKSLQLQGFKSFPDKTVLTFDQGATVVVGPNGSGKSNIADAMKWVLGELSTKNLRGSKMEDVIFGGTDDRGPMSFAEVSVTFDNSGSDGMRIQSDYDEVTVTRRYYRAGESEYMINKSPCRRKDIEELFMNTGIGREGYSIIGQGKIAEIISQKSDDRRHVFEEAAGISKYKYKKEEAQKKLLGVEENLDRVTDILSELTARIGPLERDAEKARVYLSLYEQKKQLDISLWLYDMVKLQESIAQLGDDCLLAQNEYDRHGEMLQDLEAQSERLFALSGENKQKIDALSEKIVSLTEEKMRLESQCRVLENEIAHIDEKRENNARDRKSQDAYLEDEQTQLAHDREMLVQMLADCESAKEACRADQEQMAQCDADTDALYRKSAELEEQAQALAQRMTEYAVALSVLESNRGAESQRRAEIEKQLEEFSAEDELLTQRLLRAQKAVESYGQRAEQLRQAQQSNRAQAAKLEENKKTLSEQQNALFVEFTAKKERMDALGRMEELLEGYSRSVRTVMQAYEQNRIGGAEIYGPLSKLISVEPRYATAVETALGAGIQNIVVRDDDSAKAAIRYLKEQGGGRATFYPLNTVRAQPLHGDIRTAEKMPGYVGVASSLVSCDSAYTVVVESLLGRTLVCDTLDHATAVALHFAFKIKVVTLDGQVINAGGSFTGGSVKHENGMLSRVTQMETLRTACETLRGQIDRLGEEMRGLGEQADELRDAADSSDADLEVINAMMQAEKTQQQVIESQLENDREAKAKLEEEMRRMQEDGEAYEARRAQLCAEKDETERRQGEIKEAQTALSEERGVLSRRMTALQKQLGTHQIALAEANKDAEIYRSGVQLHEGNIAAAHDRFAAIDADNATLEQTRMQHQQQIAEMTAQCAQTVQETEESEQQRATLIANNSEFEQQSAELRTKIRDGNHTKELLFQQLTVAKSKKEAALNEQDKKAAALWDEYELTFTTAQALDYPEITAQTRGENAREQGRIRQEIKALGHVNVGAIEEYAQVKERHDFLSAQVEDLNQSRSDLVQIVFQLEEEMRRKFTAAMTDINREFKIVFTELFGGGHAELVLSDPDNVLESGVEIVVAPPGKIIKNLMLLSGGEQAFVAIALYFALLKVNPAPFCILDEIEAALDEVNVDKFADYLKRHSDRTQFIVITHRRGTMEIADRLYGVTMQEKGISVVLSINANEVGNYLK